MDSETLPDAEWARPLPPLTPWRNVKKERGPLNVDQSRIETEFILGNEFIHDVNIMLDSIFGWPQDQFEHIRYAFQKDDENRDRRVEFVHMRDKSWTVRLLRLESQDSVKVHGPANVYALDDLPDDCRTFGCVDGCPSSSSFMEQTMSPRHSRNGLNMKKPLNIMVEACRMADWSLRTLLDSSFEPRPPIPPRSDKRRMPAPKAPRLESLESPITGATVIPHEQVDELLRRNSYLQDRVRQWKMIASGQLPPNTPLIARKDSAFDKQGFGPLGGKLKHVDKIPTGPNSIRVEEYMLTSKFDKRSKAPALKDESVRNKPRETYYAQRVSSKSDSDDGGSDAPLSAKTEQPASNSPNSSSSSTTSKFTSLPNCKFNPDNYLTLQAAKAEILSIKRSQQVASRTRTSVPNTGAMAHLTKGCTIGTPPMQEQSGRKSFFHRALQSQFKDTAAAHRESENSQVFEDSPPPEEGQGMVDLTDPPDAPPKEQPAKGIGSERQQEFSQSAMDACQQHIRRMMGELSSRMDTITATPVASDVDISSDGNSDKPVDRKWKGKGKGRAKYDKGDRD